MEEMVRYIKEIFGERIRALKWMDTATKNAR